MNRLQEISLRANKKQIPLIRSLIAAAKEHGASVKEFEAACTMAQALLEGQLLTKPITELCDDVEASVKNIEESV